MIYFYGAVIITLGTVGLFFEAPPSLEIGFFLVVFFVGTGGVIGGDFAMGRRWMASERKDAVLKVGLILLSLIVVMLSSQSYLEMLRPGGIDENFADKLMWTLGIMVFSMMFIVGSLRRVGFWREQWQQLRKRSDQNRRGKKP